MWNKTSSVNPKAKPGSNRSQFHKNNVESKLPVQPGHFIAGTVLATAGVACGVIITCAVMIHYCNSYPLNS
jgi:hypothetical protein